MLRAILITLTPFLLFGKVSLEAPQSFYKGNSVLFTLTAQGSDIRFPHISKIEDFIVQDAGTSTSTSIINGVKSQTLSKSYLFVPNKTVTIPSFEVEIDGIVEKTEPKKVVAKNIEKTVSDLYSLDISVDKKELYVGEEVVFSVKFKYNEGINLVDLEFFRPNFESFWAKELGNGSQKKEGSFFVTELKYLLFPQKPGQIVIDPLRVNLILSDNSRGNYGFFSQILTKKVPVFSNDIKLDVKALPKGIDLTGEFQIESKIDKNELKNAEALSYTLVIKGRGNLDDIGEIKLDIPNATVYENPAKKEFDIKDGKYGGVYTKTYSIVSSSDFTVPSVELKYFDKKENKIKTVKTNSYHIKVQSGKKEKKPELEVSKEDQTNNALKSKAEENIIRTASVQEKIFFYLLGFISAWVVVFSYGFFRKKERYKKEETKIERSIKSSKTKEELFKMLVIYINIDTQLDKIIFDLEKKDQVDLKQCKKDILKIIKDKKLEI